MMQTQRKAFSMLTAIFIIVLMASVGAFVMSLSGKIIKTTTNLYQKEQAALLAKSYTELAIMTVMANDRNGTGTCVRDINSAALPFGSTTGTSTNGQGFNVRTRIGFIGAASDIGTCAGTRQFGNPTAGNNELNIIVDVYVEYKDISQVNPSASPWITYHRRTLQKI